jgi:hypothetical protein
VTVDLQRATHADLEFARGLADAALAKLSPGQAERITRGATGRGGAAQRVAYEGHAPFIRVDHRLSWVTASSGSKRADYDAELVGAYARAYAAALRDAGYKVAVEDQTPAAARFDGAHLEVAPGDLRWPFDSTQRPNTIVVGTDRVTYYGLDHAELVKAREELLADRHFAGDPQRAAVSSVEPWRARGSRFTVVGQSYQRSPIDYAFPPQGITNVARVIKREAVNDRVKELADRELSHLRSAHHDLGRKPSADPRYRMSPNMRDLHIHEGRLGVADEAGHALEHVKPLAALLRHSPGVEALRASLEAMRADALDPAQAWTGLRRGSPTARAVGLAILVGELRADRKGPYDYSFEWVYRGARGQTAYEAWKAGGGRA